jgi:LysM repeat protein/ABC-type branched-subunit amino acid transport system substrate-binding protein
VKVLLKVILTVILISILSSSFSIAQNNQKKSDIIENYKGSKYYMHFVQVGETLQSIAKLYNVSNVEILKANPEIATGLQPNKVIRIPLVSEQSNNSVTKQDTINQAQPQGKSQTSVHTVQAKETWYGIARQYNVPVKELIKANPNIDTLKVGMPINIPAISEGYKVITQGYAEHTVMPKETLYSLSKQFETTVEELIRLNPSLSDGLKTGQVIMVPTKSVNNEPRIQIQVTDTTYIKHEVMRKETLYSISRLYGVDQNDILKANPSLNGKINKGDILRIPKVVKEVRAAVRPDTTILGRPINIQAKEENIKVPCTVMSNKNVQYNIALLVPMQLENVDSISVSDPSGLKAARESVCFDFIEFYEGALIAADSLASRGMNVKVHVFDADFGDEIKKTRRLLNNREMTEMDLIIGPFFAESFNLVAEFAKNHHIPVINPLSRRAELVKDNEYIVKMQPSGWAQYNALAQYVKSAHSDDNIVIVKHNQEENKGLIQTIKSILTNDSTKNIQVKEVTYSASGNGMSKSLSPTKTNFLIIATSDKAILPAILRDLAAKTSDYKIEIVGLAEWEEMELDYNYLIKLNTHFFKAWYVDYSQPPVKHFLKTFRSRYIAEPEVDKYAYLGYDATLYFLSALYNYGSGFLNCIENFNQPGLSNDLKFKKISGGGYENYGTSVFKYTDFTRQRLN